MNALVFKNITEEYNETWEDTCKTLSYFIILELNITYSHDDIDLIFRWNHGGAEYQEDLKEHQRKNHKDLRPIFDKFTNWRVAEDIRNKTIIPINNTRIAKAPISFLFIFFNPPRHFCAVIVMWVFDLVDV